MKREARVLIVDDQDAWRQMLTRTLSRGTFAVDSAASAREAHTRLADGFYHLVVLDIRMEESDAENVEGMTLLADLERMRMGEDIKVIMLSAHGTREQMRHAFREYRVADFLTKEQFDNLQFLKQVQSLFADELRINLDLMIHWQQSGGAKVLVPNLVLNGERVRKRPAPFQERVASELEDLLCRLFYQAESILVRPLTTGHSGAGVLWVQPFYSAGGGRAVIVKFGGVELIEREYANFKEVVQPFIGGGRSTTVLDKRRTALLSGITYSLLGTETERLENFATFYRHASVEEIRQVLDRLFLETCGAWYANLGQLKPYDLTEDYQTLLGFTPDNLERAFSQLKGVQGKERLHFRGLGSGQTIANPILAMREARLVRSTYRCITHGDFTAPNILVDEQGHSWLIDFLQTGQGHILRDVVRLDSSLRCQLLAPEDATLEERFQLEEALWKFDRFGQLPTRDAEDELSTNNTTLARAYAISLHLRRIAHRLLSQNPGADFSEYQIASFYDTLNTIRFYSLATVQREHALLCAGLLAERIGL